MSHFYFSYLLAPSVYLHQVLEKYLLLVFQKYPSHLRDVALLRKSIHHPNKTQDLLTNFLPKVSLNFHDESKLGQAFKHLHPRQRFSSVFTEEIFSLISLLSSVMLRHRLLDECCFSLCCSLTISCPSGSKNSDSFLQSYAWGS